MSTIMNNNLSKLWIRIKSYINARLESLDVTVEGIVNNAVENAGYTDIELLWENASPESNFTTQTISLDLSKYDYVLLDYKGIVTSSHCEVDLVKVGQARYFTYIRYLQSEVVMTCYSRSIRASIDGVVAGTCHHHNFTDKVLTAADNGIVPISIYGIRG